MTKTIVGYVTLLINDFARTHDYVCHKHKYEKLSFFLLFSYVTTKCHSGKEVEMKDSYRKKNHKWNVKKCSLGMYEERERGKKSQKVKKYCLAFLFSFLLTIPCL